MVPGQKTAEHRHGTDGSALAMTDVDALPIKRLTLPCSAGVVLWLAGPADPGGVPPHLWNTLLAAERERAKRFINAPDRILFAMTRAVLRTLLSEATSVPADQILFAEEPFGKPRLAGISGPHFNVSHSGSWALIGVSDRRPIGVDIELMRRAGGELELARSFFSDAEYHALEGLDNSELLQAFYKIWTCKEAVLKALGAGISEHLKDFSVELMSDRYAIHAEPNCFLPALASVVANPVEVPRGYAGCYALA
jgi:4'-phosphopantetheinyl transferase